MPFTAAVARAQGVPRYLLTRWCQQGLLRQPIRRVYVSSALPDSPLLRAQCLSPCHTRRLRDLRPPRGMAARRGMVLAPNEHLHARPISMFRPSGNGRLENGIVVSGERNLIPSDITEVLGLPVTTMLRTAWDLGRVRRREDAISALDQMFRLPGFPLKPSWPASNGSGHAVGHHLAGHRATRRRARRVAARVRSCGSTGSTSGFPGRTRSSRSGATASSSLESTSATRISATRPSTTARSCTPPTSSATTTRAGVEAIERTGFVVDVFTKQTSSARCRDAERRLLTAARDSRPGTARRRRITRARAELGGYCGAVTPTRRRLLGDAVGVEDAGDRAHRLEDGVEVLGLGHLEGEPALGDPVAGGLRGWR